MIAIPLAVVFASIFLLMAFRVRGNFNNRIE